MDERMYEGRKEGKRLAKEQGRIEGREGGRREGSKLEVYSRRLKDLEEDTGVTEIKKTPCLQLKISLKTTTTHGRFTLS